MRPRYCREQDDANDLRVLRRFAALIPGRTEVVQNHRGDNSAFDGAILLDGKLAAICEVKGRTGDGSRFETWHIAKDKLDRCVADANTKGVPFFVIFSWGDDKAFYWKVRDVHNLQLREGGRWDRGDVHDVEIMAHIPRSFFKQIP